MSGPERMSTSAHAAGRFLASVLSGMILLAGPAAMTEEPDAAADAAQPDGETVGSPDYVVGGPDGLAIDNPGSFPDQFRRDRERKDYLFQIPGADLVLGPWGKLRARLDEKYGFRPALSITHIYQWADDTVGPKEQASGLDIAIDATWTFFGLGTDSTSMAGFEFLYRDNVGTDVPPVALFGQIGSLYPTTVAFGEVDPTIGQLWLQQIVDKKVGFRIGKYNPVPAYDFFPMKNFRTDFVDGIHAANVIIPLPSRGLGGYAMWRPEPRVYVRAGIHDANAETDKAGFDTFFDDAEYFKIFEVGFDPGFEERKPGAPPAGDVHVSFWHQEDRRDANVDDGWGFVVAGSQRFGRFLPFLRYGYAEGGRMGPSPIEHMVNGGLAIDDIFGQSKDRIGLGITWSRPADGSLDDQGAIDAFYRVQVTPQIALTPTMQMIIEPVRNPNEDVVWVLGIRSRFAF